ncbi:NADH-quinone oxidoreductase subunit C [Desulfuromonas sp. TF]|uniref:NADH-quinone oxidoreductase subunit C n=1 Tax=Desulfuromonas sp. TF TaxID=1232410 RepID=UPI0004229DF1|nr:NADH-quinone oxidoreductase subunit C [Desulfuromonas sp. TF]
MTELQEIIPIDKSDLVGLVAEMFAEGYRLVQIGCSTLADGYELTWSFDRDYRFRSLRITAAPEEEVPSISVIYPNAFLYENEIHDLFGVVITHIAVDYRGSLYRTAIGKPFSVDNVKLPEPPKRKAPVSGEKPETGLIGGSHKQQGENE